MLLIYSPRCLEYAAPGHPEGPDRIRRTVELLRKDYHIWLTPEPCAEEDLLRVHTPGHLRAVRTGEFSDADTPFFPQIDDLARLSAGAAVLAAHNAREGRPAFSLMRPPGHHAERDRIMGFCYYNNIAVAVARLLAEPSAPGRVAILDFDCHHGNGTADIFRNDPRVLCVSLHQSPCYPWTGMQSEGNCLNYVLPPGTLPDPYLKAFDSALERIAAFAPDLMAVSAGFDAHKNDPITHLGLEVETFHELGRRLKAFCDPAGQEHPVPCFAVLEGGYAGDVAHCVEAFVHGWEQH